MARFGILQLLLAATARFGAAVPDCKCSPLDPCWPSENIWSELNTTLSGKLIKAVLPGSVCYSSHANYDQVACQELIPKWSRAEFHSSDPISVHAPQIANNSCNPIYDNGTSIAGDPMAGSRGCTFGRYPRYVVNATSASDVQAAVKFASKWNLRLNVKNTGHGQSVAFGSLSIWTHNLKKFKYIPDFTEKCPTGAKNDSISPRIAFNVGAGIQDDEAFKAAAKYNAVVVGGTNGDVGLAGWATGGGHGWLTSEYGQGADSIIEAMIVTPIGDIVIANSCQNSDLFWAIRGGGGGTFGVIVEMTVKAHTMPQATVWTIQATKSNNTSSSEWWKTIATLHTELPALKKGGFQGFYTIGGPPSYNTLTFYGFFFLYNKPNGTAEALTKPFLKILDMKNSSIHYSSDITWSPDWISVYKSLPMAALSGAAGGGGTTASRLLPPSAIADSERLARVLELVGPTEGGEVGGISNPTIAGGMVASSISVDNALNPAWRKAVVHFYVTTGWRDSLPYWEVQKANDDMTNIFGAALRTIAPDAGVYFNEADPFEPNWQNAFWGPNYPRLRAIKKKYDPESLQWCAKCAGSEDWREHMDGRLCRVPTP